MAADLFRVAPGAGCVRDMGADVGVRRVRFTALVDLELWAACATGSYDYDCNHELVAAGDTIELPRSPIGVYDALLPHITDLGIERPGPVAAAGTSGGDAMDAE